MAAPMAEIHIDVKQQHDTIHILTPCKENYTAVVDRIRTTVPNTVTIRARIINHPGGYLIVTTHEKHTQGILEIPGKNLSYQIITDLPSGKTYLLELSGPDNEKDASPIPPTTPQRNTHAP